MFGMPVNGTKDLRPAACRFLFDRPLTLVFNCLAVSRAQLSSPLRIAMREFLSTLAFRIGLSGHKRTARFLGAV